MGSSRVGEDSSSTTKSQENTVQGAPLLPAGDGGSSDSAATAQSEVSGMLQTQGTDGGGTKVDQGQSARPAEDLSSLTGTPTDAQGDAKEVEHSNLGSTELGTDNANAQSRLASVSGSGNGTEQSLTGGMFMNYYQERAGESLVRYTSSSICRAGRA